MNSPSPEEYNVYDINWDDIYDIRNIQYPINARMPSFKKCLWGFLKCDTPKFNSPIRLQAKSHIQRNVTIKTRYTLKEKVVEVEEQTTNLMIVGERCTCGSIRVDEL